MELKSLLALFVIPSISSSTLFKITKHFSEPEMIFKESKTTLTQLGFSDEQIKHIHHPDYKQVEEILLWKEKPQHYIITFFDSNYPSALKEIASPPYLLFIKGNLSILNNIQLAMVGSRNPTPMGYNLAYQFAYELAQYEITITSGLALGIDGASHQGALEAQGHTIAILGTGLNYIYPKRHQKLAQDMIQKGALVSEFPLNTPPLRENFPRRNRIISGLTSGTVIIEAALKSGSLITARYALEQGREVFAIPHSIHNPLGKGCHLLLKQGAIMVESVQDILEEIAPHLEVHKKSLHLRKTMDNLAPEERKLVECLQHQCLSLEHLISLSGLPSYHVKSIIVQLEMKQIVTQTMTGYTLNFNDEMMLC